MCCRLKGCRPTERVCVAQECFKGCWASHKKLHKLKPDVLELVSSWGLSRVMAAEVLVTMDLGNITAV